MAKVVILKQPLYGTVYWNGYDFVYTPKPGASTNDSYIYSLTDNNGKTQVLTKYVNPVNTQPVVTSPSYSLSTTVYADTIIQLSSLVTDNTDPFNYLRFTELSKPKYGDIFNEGSYVNYVSKAEDVIETINYKVSDKEFTSTGTFTVSVFGIYGPKPPKVDVISNETAYLNLPKTLRLFSEVILDKEVNWDTLHDILTTYQSDWDALDASRQRSFATSLSAASGNWKTISERQSAYKAVYSILSANSGSWNEQGTALSSLSTFFWDNWLKWDTTYTTVSVASSNWDQITYTLSPLTAQIVAKGQELNSMSNTLCANSGTWTENTQTYHITGWNSMYDLIVLSGKDLYWDNIKTNTEMVSSDYYKNKDKLNSWYNTIFSNSSIVNEWMVLSLMRSMSAKWTSAESGLTALSATWIFNETPELANWFSLVTANSANWNNMFNLVTANSSDWIYKTSVADMSGVFLSGSPVKDLEAHDMIVYGNALVSGDLIATGTYKQIDTTVVTTESFKIVNKNEKDALVVTKIGNLGNISKMEYPAGNTILVVDAARGNVGINIEYPNESLTIQGNISSNVYTLPIINEIMTQFRPLSSKWEKANLYISTSSTNIDATLVQKNGFDNAFSLANSNSANISNMFTLTGNYDNAYSVITAQSGMNTKTNNYITLCATALTQDRLYRFNKNKYDNFAAFYNGQQAGNAFGLQLGYNFTSKDILTAGEVYLMVNDDVNIKSWTIVADEDTFAEFDVLVSDMTFYPTAKSIVDYSGLSYPPKILGTNIASRSDLVGRWNTLRLTKGTILIIKIVSNTFASSLYFNLNVEKV